MKRMSFKKGILASLMAAGVVVAFGVTAASAATISSALLGGSGSDEATGEAFEWTDDADCSLCHVKQTESFEDAGLLANKHAAVECVYCHEYQEAEIDAGANEEPDTVAGDGEEGVWGSVDGQTQIDSQATPSMAEIHADVTEVSTVKKNALVDTAISEEVCLSCHDRDDLIEATADCDVLTDAHGTTVNPHDIIEGSQHEAVLCEDCHKMHSSDPSASYRACVGCHHAEVWECGTCHSYVSNETL